MANGNGTKRKQHPNSLANLRPPWTAETRPNKEGRRGPIITPALRRVVERAPGEKFNPRTNADVVAQGIFVQATQGNGSAIRTIMDRVDGVLKEEREVTIRTVDEMDDAELDAYIAGFVRGNAGVAGDESADRTQAGSRKGEGKTAGSRRKS